MEVVESDSLAATEELGARIADRLQPGDVFVVSGDLGAVKTSLIRGICRELGVTEPVTSPTFTIGQRYSGGRMPVSHLDLYRLASLAPEEPALLDDYLDPTGVAFVEWPAVAEPSLGPVALAVRIEHAGAEARRIELDW